MDKYIGKPEGRISFDMDYYEDDTLKNKVSDLIDILIHDKYQVLIKNEDGIIIVDYCYDPDVVDYGADRFKCVTYDGQELLYSSEYDEEEKHCGRFKWDTCTEDQIDNMRRQMDNMRRQMDICDDEKARIKKEMESY